MTRWPHRRLSLKLEARKSHALVLAVQLSMAKIYSSNGPPNLDAGVQEGTAQDTGNIWENPATKKKVTLLP